MILFERMESTFADMSVLPESFQLILDSIPEATRRVNSRMKHESPDIVADHTMP